MTSIVTANITTSGVPAYYSTGTTAVTFMSLCNISSGNVTANVYVVSSGLAFGPGNQVMANLPITSYDTYQLYLGAEKLILSDGDAIWVSCSSNTAITTVASYTSI